MPDRAHAVTLLEEWVKNEGLQNHMYAVEAAVRHYARLRGEDEDVWGLAGLLHDLDWEKFPDNHPVPAVNHLRKFGYPEIVLQAILAHRSDFTGVEPQSELDKVLVACDELSGIVFACCLVRPNGIDDLKPKSVGKKLKDRTFAAGARRAPAMDHSKNRSAETQPESNRNHSGLDRNSTEIQPNSRSAEIRPESCQHSAGIQPIPPPRLKSTGNQPGHRSAPGQPGRFPSRAR